MVEGGSAAQLLDSAAPAALQKFMSRESIAVAVETNGFAEAAAIASRRRQEKSSSRCDSEKSTSSGSASKRESAGSASGTIVEE